MVKIQPSASQGKPWTVEDESNQSCDSGHREAQNVAVFGTGSTDVRQCTATGRWTVITEDVLCRKESTSTQSDSDNEALERSRRFCWGVCCMQGCIWAVLGAIYFFFFLPTGFLLVLYGTNKDIPWAIATGTIILSLLTCGLPSLCLCVRWYRRKQKDKRAESRLQRDQQLAKVTFNNPTNSEDDAS